MTTEYGHIGGRGMMVHLERDLGKVSLVPTKCRNMGKISIFNNTS